MKSIKHIPSHAVPLPEMQSSLQTMIAQRYPDLVRMERQIGTCSTHVAYIRELQSNDCQNE